MRILTSRLLGVLADLLQTTHTDPDAGAIGGILLHTGRGHHGAEPGALELFAGISTDRLTAGHTYTPCAGQLSSPTLWARRDVRNAITVFKAARGKDKQDVHAVEIRCSGGEVEIREDPNLIDDGVKLLFGELDAGDFPARGAYRLLDEVGAGPVVVDDRIVPATAATHYQGALLAPFCAVARRRGELIRLYRHHQNRSQLVQIGPAYRGVLAPTIPTESGFDPEHPDADIYPPDLDDPRWKPRDRPAAAPAPVDVDALFEASDSGEGPAGA